MFKSLLPVRCRRMKIFLSYAHEDFAIAEKIAQTLRAAGHTVFFDKSSLTGGDDYTAKIRDEINASERFVFLVSRDALDAGGFTLTELRLARERWPGGAEAVLPVIIDKGLDLKTLPVYLASVHMFQPEGNIPAETANEVEKGATVNGFCRTCVGLAGLAMASLFAFLTYAFVDTYLRPTEVTMAPIPFVHFRPAVRPPADSKTSKAWLDAPAMLVMPVSYSHRTQPGKDAQIGEERVELQVGAKTIPYSWLYRVDIRNGCNSGDQWLCSLGPVEPQTLGPGKTVSRETMYQPKPGSNFSYGALIAALEAEGAGQVRVKLVPSITVAKKGKTPTEVICELDAKAAREWLLADWSKYQERPSWFRRDCLAK